MPRPGLLLLGPAGALVAATAAKETAVQPTKAYEPMYETQQLPAQPQPQQQYARAQQVPQPQYYETEQYAQPTTRPYEQEVYEEVAQDYPLSYEDTARERALKLFETPQKKYAVELPKNDSYEIQQPIESVYEESFPETEPNAVEQDEVSEASEDLRGFKNFQSNLQGLHDINEQGKLQINYQNLGLAIAITAGIWYLLKRR